MLEQDHVGDLNTNSEAEHPIRTIACVDCGEFHLDFRRAGFFSMTRIEERTETCKPCKQAKMKDWPPSRRAVFRRATSIEVSVQCAQCGQQTTVPFYPSQADRFIVAHAFSLDEPARLMLSAVSE